MCAAAFKRKPAPCADNAFNRLKLFCTLPAEQSGVFARDIAPAAKASPREENMQKQIAGFAQKFKRHKTPLKLYSKHCAYIIGRVRIFRYVKMFKVLKRAG